MRNLLTIMRRELGAYVNSPIGAIFLVVFTLIASGLFVTEFFLFPVAELRSFFSTLPFVLCVFVPAVTMRLWAEERATNTVEMLLTFPMHPLALVLGKYMASLCFLLSALGSTLLLPLMLAVLGDPDFGQMASSYLGAVLLGAFFLALGQLVSGFAKDQIVAFVLSLLACFTLFLLGTSFIATALDGWISGLGTTLRQLLGVTSHYNVFIRGIVELADVAFFAGWTVIFLFLNGLYVEGRNRKAFGALFALAAVLCLGIGLVLNALVKDMSLGRFDWTAERIHTISVASQRILAELPAPVQVTYYVTPEEDMPTEIKSLERDVLDRLEELRLASAGKLTFTRVHMRAANVLGGGALEQQAKPEDALEKRMLEKGIEPFSVSALRQTGSVSNLIYSSLGVAYLNKPEEIIPRIVPDSLSELEFALVSAVYRLSLDKQPVVVVAGGEQFGLVRQVLEQEKYQVRTLSPQEEALPVDADVLLVLDPQHWSPRQAWELRAALAGGQKTILAVQAQQWDYNLNQGAIAVQRIPQESGLDDLLDTLGVRLEPKVLMDEQSIPIRVARSQVDQIFGGGLNLNLPMHIVLTKNAMNPAEPITARLENLFYLWGSALSIDQAVLNAHGLNATVLASSSQRSWLIDPPATLTQAMLTPPQEGRGSYPVAVRIQGQFPATTEPAPPTAEPGGQAAPSEELLQRTPRPGELILVGGATMFGDDMLQNNVDFLLNAVDYLVHGPDLIQIRGKKIVSRAILDVTPEQAAAWKFMTYCLPTLCIAGMAAMRAWARIRRRRLFAHTLERLS